MKFQAVARGLTVNLFIKTTLAPVTISGKIGEDAKSYQERQVEQALEQVKA